MLKVGFNPTVSFKAGEEIQSGNKREDQNFTTGEIKESIPDSFENSMEEVAQNLPEMKKPKNLRDGAANVWKFFTVANQMANSALKGLFYGAMTGAAFLSGSWLFKSLPNAFKKEGPTLKSTLIHPLKNIGKSGKILAGVASGVVLAYQLIAGKLEANQKTAVIDHKLKVGHRDV